MTVTPMRQQKEQDGFRIMMDIDYDELARAIATAFPAPPERTPGTVELPRLLTFKECKQYLQISDNSMRNLIERGEITAHKICGKYLIKADDVDEFLVNHQPLHAR